MHSGFGGSSKYFFSVNGELRVLDDGRTSALGHGSRLCSICVVLTGSGISVGLEDVLASEVHFF